MYDQKNTVPTKEGEESTPSPMNKNQKPGDEKQNQKTNSPQTTK